MDLGVLVGNMEIAEIDKNYLIRRLTEYAEGLEENGYLRDGAIDAVKTMRYILDAVPVIQKEVHAKWVDRYRNGYKPPNVVICSHCNKPSYEFDENHNIIPVTGDHCDTCGAKMDEELQFRGLN